MLIRHFTGFGTDSKNITNFIIVVFITYDLTLIRTIKVMFVNLLFFSFPKDVQTKQKWIDVIRIARRDDYWIWNKYSRICSDHFLPNDFYVTKKGMRKCHKTAVPKIQVSIGAFTSFKELFLVAVRKYLFRYIINCSRVIRYTYLIMVFVSLYSFKKYNLELMMVLQKAMSVANFSNQ